MSTLKALEQSNPFINPADYAAAGKMETQHKTRYVQTINTAGETHAQKLERQAAERERNAAAHAAAHAAKTAQDEQDERELESWLNSAAQKELDDYAAQNPLPQVHTPNETSATMTQTALQTIEHYIWTKNIDAIVYNCPISGAITIEYNRLTLRFSDLAKLPKIKGWGKEIGAGYGTNDTPSPAVVYYNRAERKRQNQAIKSLL